MVFLISQPISIASSVETSYVNWNDRLRNILSGQRKEWRILMNFSSLLQVAHMRTVDRYSGYVYNFMYLIQYNVSHEFDSSYNNIRLYAINFTKDIDHNQ